jgi:hypothetical protein
MAELFVPKTGDLQKILARQVEAPVGNEFFAMLGANQEEMRPAGMTQEEWDDMRAASTDGSRAVRDFSAAQSIGTSLAVSFALLGIATWRFSRRDF